MNTWIKMIRCYRLIINLMGLIGVASIAHSVNLNQSSSNLENQPILISKKFSLHHRTAQDVAQLFLGKTNPANTSNSSCVVDKQSNSLWIQDTPEHVEKLEKLIQAFDHPIPQILIEARIVNVDRHFERELGIRFGLIDTTESTRQKLSSVHQLNASANTSPTLNSHVNIELPAGLNQAATFGIALARLGQHHLLDLELSALESAGGGQIISSPHLITTNQTEAIISAGVEIPYLISKSPGKKAKGSHLRKPIRQSRSSIQFKKATLALKVTPQLLENQRILLNLQLNHSQPLSRQDKPSLETRALKTQVIVNSGETIVLGGIYERAQNYAIRRVPFLSSLPLFGALFSHRIQIDRTKELLIFVTPHILIASPLHFDTG